MAPLEIAVTNGDNHVLQLAVAGEVDMSTSPKLLDAVLSAAVVSEQHHIVIDLRDVSLIDSSGLDAIVHAVRRVRDLKAHLIICNPSHAVQRMFELTGLDDVLDVRPVWRRTPSPAHRTRTIGGIAENYRHQVEPAGHGVLAGPAPSGTWRVTLREV